MDIKKQFAKLAQMNIGEPIVIYNAIDLMKSDDRVAKFLLSFKNLKTRGIRGNWSKID